MKKQAESKYHVQDDPSVIEARAVIEQCSEELRSVTAALETLISREEPVTDPLTKARHAITGAVRDDEAIRLQRRKASLEEALPIAEAEVQRRISTASRAVKASYRPKQNALRFATIEAAEALLIAIKAEDAVLDELLEAGAEHRAGSGVTLGHLADMTAASLADLIERLRRQAELERCELTADDGSVKRVRLLRDAAVSGQTQTIGSVIEVPGKEAARLVLNRAAEWTKAALFKATRQTRQSEPSCLE